MTFIASKIEVFISQEKKLYPLLLEGRMNIYCVANTYQPFHRKIYFCYFYLVQTTLTVDIISSVFRWAN